MNWRFSNLVGTKAQPTASYEIAYHRRQRLEEYENQLKAKIEENQYNPSDILNTYIVKQTPKDHIAAAV